MAGSARSARLDVTGNGRQGGVGTARATGRGRLGVAYNNSQMNEYMKERWRKRRAAAIHFLGGRCAVCGATEDLEFDHLDPSTKIMTIAKASSRSEQFFWNEVRKCQLLCRNHHAEKNRKEKQVPHGGGLSGRKGCKCFLCKRQKRQYMKTWRKKNR